MPRFHIHIRERHKLLLLLLAGIAGSILLFGKMGDSMKEEILSGGQAFFLGLAQDSVAEPDTGAETGQADTPDPKRQELLFRLLLGRAWLPVLWIILCFTAFGTASLYLFWVYLGFAAGVLLWTVTVYGGWRGPFYFWGLIFPQYLLYVPAFLLFDIACLRWNQFWRKRYRHARKLSVGRPQIRIFVLRLFLGTSLYALGIWTEWRLNPWFLKEIFIKP